MPLLVVAIMSQLVFSGGMIPVTGRLVLDQMSWFTPARWGFAASASTVDLTQAGARPADAARTRTGSTPRRVVVRHGACWRAICVGYLSFVRWKIRLKGG